MTIRTSLLLDQHLLNEDVDTTTTTTTDCSGDKSSHNNENIIPRESNINRLIESIVLFAPNHWATIRRFCVILIKIMNLIVIIIQLAEMLQRRKANNWMLSFDSSSQEYQGMTEGTIQRGVEGAVAAAAEDEATLLGYRFTITALLWNGMGLYGVITHRLHLVRWNIIYLIITMMMMTNHVGDFTNQVCFLFIHIYYIQQEGQVLPKNHDNKDHKKNIEQEDDIIPTIVVV
jgi:hypothetical protein